MNDYLLKRILEELPRLSNDDLMKLSQAVQSQIAQRSLALLGTTPYKPR